MSEAEMLALIHEEIASLKIATYIMTELLLVLGMVKQVQL